MHILEAYAWRLDVRIIRIWPQDLYSESLDQPKPFGTQEHTPACATILEHRDDVDATLNQSRVNKAYLMIRCPPCSSLGPFERDSLRDC